MKKQVTIPQIGESVSEAQVSRWLVQNAEYVQTDQDIAEIDSDKTTLTIASPASGMINILVSEGSIVKIGQLIAEIDTTAESKIPPSQPHNLTEETNITEPAAQNTQDTKGSEKPISDTNSVSHPKVVISPLAKQKMKDQGILPEEIVSHTLNVRLGVHDVEKYISHKQNISLQQTPAERSLDRKTMSPLRKKLAQRLVAVKNQTAMLTTFNEIDMSQLIELRSKFKEDFFTKHGVKLGFMSFFVKACTIALRKFPSVNAMIDKDDVIYFNYCDISIAVSTDKGLVVPVVRNTDQMSIPQIEKEISTLAEKARSFKLLPEDLEGGTFTITNGGVFGSLLSTPIINPPQTAILGMHTIQDRPVAISGQVVIKPMMYIALSYDHRLIDGKESVGFVMEVKRLLENPAFLHYDDKNTFGQMLEI